MHKFCTYEDCMVDNFARQAGVDQEDVVHYKRSSRIHAYEPGDAVFKQNSPPGGIYCIQSGHILLWHADALGNEIGFRVAGANEIIGHRSCFGEEPHAATAVALTKCIVCRHHPEAITGLFSKYPAFSGLFLRLLARDRGPPDSLLLRNPYLPVKVRIINMLLILHGSHEKALENGDVQIQLPFYRRDIARMIAARPETVARTIKELNRAGLVIFKGRIATIPDMQRLRDSIKVQEER